MLCALELPLAALPLLFLPAPLLPIVSSAFPAASADCRTCIRGGQSLQFLAVHTTKNSHHTKSTNHESSTLHLFRPAYQPPTCSNDHHELNETTLPRNFCTLEYPEARINQIRHSKRQSAQAYLQLRVTLNHSSHPVVELQSHPQLDCQTLFTKSLLTTVYEPNVLLFESLLQFSRSQFILPSMHHCSSR